MADIKAFKSKKSRSGVFYISLVLLLLVSAGFFSQPSAVSFSLSKPAVKTLVDSLASLVGKFYVDADAARKISLELKKRFREGRYNNVHDPHLLAALLTEDVTAVHRDEHFHVEYNPALANELSGNIDDVPRMVAEKLELERMRNFGFRKAEILSGNIGYLEISSFSRLNQYSRAAADAAFAFVSGTDALIIDLRYGSGGSPDMVTYLLGHFFKERTHIADIYIRSENATLPYWTQPDSSKRRLSEIPVYILSSYKTFSAAESFIYAMKNTKRAVLVGETTRGGAHTVSYRPLSSGFVCDIPFGKALSPVTRSNWERTGIAPDVPVQADEALPTAARKIFDVRIASSRDSAMSRSLRWHRDILLSTQRTHVSDSTAEAAFAGKYGAYSITRENGRLYYQKTGKARFPLIPMSGDALRPQGNDSFIVQLYRDSSGQVNRIATLYEDGRIEHALRSR